MIWRKFLARWSVGDDNDFAFSFAFACYTALYPICRPLLVFVLLLLLELSIQIQTSLSTNYIVDHSGQCIMLLLIEEHGG